MPTSRGRPVAWKNWYSSRRWRRLKQLQLQRQPWCSICADRGELGIVATEVDHVEPHRGDRAKFFLGELQSLCKHCHDSVKRGIEIRGFDATLIDEHGWPADPRHPANKR